LSIAGDYTLPAILYTQQSSAENNKRECNGFDTHKTNSSSLLHDIVRSQTRKWPMGEQ